MNTIRIKSFRSQGPREQSTGDVTSILQLQLYVSETVRPLRNESDWDKKKGATQTTTRRELESKT